MVQIPVMKVEKDFLIKAMLQRARLLQTDYLDKEKGSTHT